ncbi:MAG: GTP-binding protein, partial [Clostridiales bacterium]|nr:GTP-binding protein [Candidatus Apopatocola equi]
MKKIVLGILAHVDAGKTTLSESLLYEAGVIRRLGRVDHRDTVLDNHRIERERGITVFSKMARLNWGDMDITLLDTPGHSDFSTEMERALQVLDYAVLVISGTDGVQAHTETLWSLLERYAIPTFIFITKMDVSALGHEAILEQLRARLSEGCIDFTHGSEEARQEQLALLSESALESYDRCGRVDPAELRRILQQRKLVPCVFGSGLKDEGVGDFLSLIEELTEEERYPADFGARVFKIARDEQGNRLTYPKITGGTLKVRTELRYGPLHGTEPLSEKVNRLRLYSGARYETADAVEAGQVCAVTGLTATWPGQGLGIEPDAASPLLEPVLGYRVMLPKGVDARQALPKLRLLEEEDPQL